MFIFCLSACPISVRGSLDTVNHSLHGIAALQNNIYALSQSPNSILVFDDKSPFALTRSIGLGDLREPCDMAGCQVAHCLYVADAVRNSVWKVSTGEDHDVSCWLEEEKRVSTLSVSSLGEVAVLRKGQKCTLSIYSEDATLIHYVLLVGELSNALHAVQKSNGNFVVAFGAGLQFGICEITKIGTVVHRFNVKDEALQVKYPCHLARGLGDQILVADFYNNRVVLLDSELKICVEILSKGHNELSFPWRLCYGESCQQLVVVHGGNKVACGRAKIVVCGLGSLA